MGKALQNVFLTLMLRFFFAYSMFYISTISQPTHHPFTIALGLFFFFKGKQAFTCVISTTAIEEIL